MKRRRKDLRISGRRNVLVGEQPCLHDEKNAEKEREAEKTD